MTTVTTGTAELSILDLPDIDNVLTCIIRYGSQGEECGNEADWLASTPPCCDRYKGDAPVCDGCRSSIYIIGMLQCMHCYKVTWYEDIHWRKL